MKRPVIICVDDENVIRVSLKDQLRRSLGDKYLIEVAESAEDAMEIVGELLDERVDIPVVLSDHLMPGIKGDQLLIRLHSISPGTLKILLTGQASAEAVGNAVNHANLYRYIAKPWEQTDLILTVTEAARRYYQDKRLDEQNEVLRATNAVLEELNRTLESKVEQRTAELRRKNDELSAAMQRLRDTQQQLIVQEKLASLGSLTAGIAHEIRNPLNFVNNFAALSNELAGEVVDRVTSQQHRLEPDVLKDIQDTLADLQQNVSRIKAHGARADSIVGHMLLHSRHGSGTLEAVDLNAVVEEAVRFGYHGLRAKDPSFDLAVEADYDAAIGAVEVVAVDIRRVLINLINNAGYALEEKRRARRLGFVPTLSISTRDLGDDVEIRVRDNGTGIPAAILDDIFKPFFTTKPPGAGTGLGLSITYEIVVQAHGGAIRAVSVEGEHTEIVVTLPKRHGDRAGGSRASPSPKKPPPAAGGAVLRPAAA